MATQVKHRRGTDAEVMAGTPAIGELWFNTTDNSIHMGDGATQGGNKFRPDINDTNSVINVKQFGAKGDGVTDDTDAIESAVNESNSTGKPVLFPAGTYKSSIVKTVQVAYEAIFTQGALLSLSGTKYIFLNGVSAGNYKIFETTDVFVDLNTPPPTSIKIRGCKINAKWFCEFVTDPELIKSIPDQTNNIMKAWRAGVGDWVIGVTGNAEFVDCVVDLGTGRYRVDKQIKLGFLDAGIYYRFSGGAIIGNGPQAAYLTRTDLSNTDPVLFCAFYTGQLTNLNHFKINAYNPDGATDPEKFSSAARAMLFCQGDSLQINNIWCSGAQVPVVDAEGVARNGVGIQISSAVDTYLTDVFIELCVTGLAIHSSTISAQNIELYTLQAHGLAFGNYMENYVSPQTTSSRFNIDGAQVIATKYAIHVLEGRGANATTVNISNCMLTGFNSEFGTYPGFSAVFVGDDSKLAGSMKGCRISDFREAYVTSRPTGQLGVIGQGFHMSGVILIGQTFSISQDAMFSLQGSAPDYVTVDGLSIDGCAGALLAIDNGAFIARGIFLKDYIGAYDAGGNRLLTSNGAPYISLTDIVRDTNDTHVVNIGFMNAGEIRVDTPDIHLVTLSNLAGGATGTKATRQAL